MQGPPSQASASAPTGRAAPMQPGATVAAPPLRVLFLDVDGVVCCNQNGQLEPDKMQQLLRITKEASAKVCLSSNWRLYEELREHLYTKLGAMGIECIGTTPDAGEATHGEGMRPCEIGAWIRFWHEDKGRQRITSFVAVDDRPLLQEKGGSVLRGAPSPPHHLTPPPTLCLLAHAPSSHADVATRTLAGHFVQTNPDLGLTERAATRIIDLLLDKPGLTDDSRRSPNSVMSFEPRAFAPATVAASAASAASAAATVAAATPPNDHGLRRVPRLRPKLGPHSAPRSAPAPRTQPFLPIGAPIGVPRSASAMGREPPAPFESRHGLRVSHLAPLPLDDGRRIAASRRAPFAGLEVQGSCMPPSWTSHTRQSTTHRLIATRTAPR